MANRISRQTSETLTLLTAALIIHLNINQNLSMNTSSIIMFLERISIESLSNKLIEQNQNALIQMPMNFQLNSTENTFIAFRVRLFIRYVLVYSMSFLVHHATISWL